MLENRISAPCALRLRAYASRASAHSRVAPVSEASGSEGQRNGLKKK